MKRLGILLAALFLLSGCAAKPTFNGSRAMNADLFEMEYTAFNGTIAHVLELHCGDVLDVSVSGTAGSVDVNVRPEGGAPIYRGVDIPDSHFQLPISADGRYEIAVTGDGARGRVRFARTAGEVNSRSAEDPNKTDKEQNP